MCKGVVMYKAYKSVIFLLLLALATACSSNNVVREHKQVWVEKLAKFNPIGKTKAELFEWQKNNNIPLNSFPNDNGILLETIKDNGFVCSRWMIFLSTEENHGKITKYSVSTSGTCL